MPVHPHSVPHPFAGASRSVPPPGAEAAPRAPWLAPSLLAADASRLGDEAVAVQRAGADWLHVDVMDGHFVPNLAYAPNVVAALRRRCTLHLDVHLMVQRPQDFVEPFVHAGADMVTFHVEACDDVRPLLARVRALGARVGLSARPGTPHAQLASYVAEVDLVLVMGVAPGFGGQSFMPDTPARLRALAEARARLGATCTLQVDGGINVATAAAAFAAGADALVAGSAVFDEVPKNAVGAPAEAFGPRGGEARVAAYAARLDGLRRAAQTPKG